MIEMIITTEDFEPRKCAEIKTFECKRFFRTAIFFIEEHAGYTESGEHMFRAIFIRDCGITMK